MAKEKPIPDHPIDTSTNAATAYAGRYGDSGDLLYVPGEGIYMRSVVNFERAAKAQAKVHGVDYKHGQILINEETIIAWTALIKEQQKLDEMKRRREKYEEKCHPGTDAEDPSKAEFLRDHSDSFRLDKSRSTASLHVTHGMRHLNGSAVQHHNYVSIKITSPDGRDICDISMSFDQFASFLVSNQATPCTLDSYWSVTEDCVLLEEVVKPPMSIKDRMVKRMGNRLDDMRERLSEIITVIQECIANNTPMRKTKLEDLHKRLGWFVRNMEANRDFTILQAKEEVTKLVEGAAWDIALDQRLSPEALMNSASLKALLQSLPVQAIENRTTTDE